MSNQSGSEKDEFGSVLEQLRKIQAAMRVCIRAIQDARGRAWEWRECRDELRGNQPLVHDEISEQRNARDELNVEVQRLKALRDEELEHARILQEKVQGVRDSQGSHKNLISREELQRRFRELEWKQQTSSLSIEEERALIEEMESISQTIDTAPPTNLINPAYTDETERLWQEIQARRDRAQEHHEAMIALVEEAQQKHQNIVQLSQSVGPSKQVIDEAHQMYVKCLQEADEMRERLDVLRSQEASLQQKLDSIRNQRKETRKAQEQAAMEKLADQAREKQKTGQKLSMQELRALMESDGLK